jgi:transcriptional regulator with XRE-family HTH domain
MSPVGRVLRDEREKQRLSLEQLSRQTRISLSYLHAIEADDVARISPFYYRSFVRQMAAALKIEYAALEPAVKAVSVSIPNTQTQVQAGYVPKLEPIRPPRDSAWGWASILFSLFAVTAVCSGLYALLDRVQFPDLSSLHRAEAISPVSLPSISPSVVRPVSGETISLKIAAVEKSWLAVETDGKRIYSGLLEADATKELEGRESAKIRTGNAGGLTVTFNGRQLGLLGQRGQVRTVLFTRGQYEILQPNLTMRIELLPGVILGGWKF